MKRAEAIKKVREIENEMMANSRISDLNRSRSISVGTAFGGSTEISMRGDSGHMWCIMQPVEVTELIHQLAANIGCHVALKPRDDFGSWREWRVPEAEKRHLNGHPPFVNDMSQFQQLGMTGFNQQSAEASVNNWLQQKTYSLNFDNLNEHLKFIILHDPEKIPELSPEEQEIVRHVKIDENFFELQKSGRLLKEYEQRKKREEDLLEEFKDPRGRSRAEIIMEYDERERKKHEQEQKDLAVEKNINKRGSRRNKVSSG